MDDLKGIIPIQKRFLLTNHLMALEFKEGFLFGRVVRRRICHYKPYSLINAAGTTVDIAATDDQAELWLRDHRNKAVDVLYLDATTDVGFPWMLHGAIGWKPHQIRVYPRIPEGSNVPGKFPSIDPIQPSSGDKTGYYSGMESPYDEPTDFMEYVIPPKMHVGHQWYNPDSEAHNPVGNLLFALYHFDLFKPDTIHNKMIRAIALRQVPAAYFTVGFTSELIGLGVTLKADWDAVPISLDKAQALGV